MKIRPEELKVFKIVETPDQVLDAITEFEGEIKRGEHKHLAADSNGFSL